MMNCKKESVKGEFINSRFQEWINQTYFLLLPSYDHNFQFKPEKEKLAAVTERARAILKVGDPLRHLHHV
jgi:hypothetical protein